MTTTAPCSAPAQGPDEIEQLVDLISTNHTRFFREPEHFTFLTGRMLPELIPRLAAEGSLAAGLVRRRFVRRGALLAGDRAGGVFP